MPAAVAPQVHAYGESAFLVACADLAEVRAVHARLARETPVGVVDLVPAARSVLVLLGGPRAAAAAGAWLRAAVADVGAVGEVPPGPLVELPVVYDGADLPDVAAWAGLDVDEVVARHAGRTYNAAFGGFAPGFTYLVGVDPAIAAPRLETPRTRVPAGAVALAGDLTAVYPASSPGGWRLLGTTDVRVFDAGREPPALVPPGARVRFVPTRARVAAAVRASSSPVVTPPAPSVAAPEARPVPAVGTYGAPALEVVATGPRTLVQDRGREGLAHVGVGRSGAADRASHALANRLVANPDDAATLEVTLGGLVVRAVRDVQIALTGAVAPATVAGVPVGYDAVLQVRAGQELRLGTPVRGLRTYVAVRGGVDVPPVLGSRASDVLSGLGPLALQPGDVLRTGPRPGSAPVVEAAPARTTVGVARPQERGVVVLEVQGGPRSGWFPPAVLRTLGGAVRTVSADSDRVALRLEGPPVARRAGESVPEGLVRGAVQVPPDGGPVVFLADHPVTGGYPVVGVLTEESADRAAQLRPGDQVRLRVRAQGQCPSSHEGGLTVARRDA
ncbi:5-oxoprolinase/urea amidolyase family protein [Cellulosimicrobium terreum]|nr:5-oxoprolinase/urea amidolyase family protein [Cellulosimicrobium terreum]